MVERRALDRSADEVRRECYNGVRACMRDRVMEYYDRYPELYNDERSKRAIKESLAGLECIFKVLDQYEIGKK